MEIRAWQETVQFQQFINIALKKEVQVKNTLKSRVTDRVAESRLRELKSHFGHITGFQTDGSSKRDVNTKRYRIGSFGNTEFSLQETMDYLEAQIKAWEPSLPLEHFDQHARYLQLGFCSFLTPEQFVELSIGKKRVKSILTEKLPKQILRKTREQFLIASAQGTINLSSDSWENVRNEKIIGFFIAGANLSATYPFAYELQHEKDDAMANIRIFECELPNIEETLGVKVKTVVTDSAAQLDKAKRILSLRYPDVIFERCYAHQANLLCKKMVQLFSQRGQVKRSVDKKSNFLVKLNFIIRKINNVREIKAAFKNRFTDFYGVGRLSPSKPIHPLSDTRWNAFYLTLSSIAKFKFLIKELIEEFKLLNDWDEEVTTTTTTTTTTTDVGKTEGKSEQKGNLDGVRSETFLNDCIKLAVLLRPIALMNLKFQTRGLNKADVLFGFLELYHFYKKKGSSEILEGLDCVIVGFIDDLERRWEKVEQPLSFLTAAFDLRYCGLVFDMMVISERKDDYDSLEPLLSFAVIKYLRKLLLKEYSDEEEVDIRKKFFKWMQGEDYYLKISSCTTSKNPADFHLLGQDDDIANLEFFELAKILVTTYCQSADCERMFSGFKRIQGIQKPNLKNESMVAYYQAGQFLRNNRKTKSPKRRKEKLPEIEIYPDERSVLNLTTAIPLGKLLDRSQNYELDEAISQVRSQTLDSRCSPKEAGAISEATSKALKYPARSLVATKINFDKLNETEEVEDNNDDVVDDRDLDFFPDDKSIHSDQAESPANAKELNQSEKAHLKEAESIEEYEGVHDGGVSFRAAYPDVSAESHQERLKYIHLVESERLRRCNNCSTDTQFVTRGSKMKLSQLYPLWREAIIARRAAISTPPASRRTGKQITQKGSKKSSRKLNVYQGYVVYKARKKSKKS